MNARFEFYSKDAWDVAERMGNALVRDQLGRAALEKTIRGAHPAEIFALCYGGLVAAAAALRTAAEPCSEPANSIEEIALACVRGALRGAKGPINADGSTWKPRSH